MIKPIKKRTYNIEDMSEESSLSLSRIIMIAAAILIFSAVLIYIAYTTSINNVLEASKSASREAAAEAASHAKPIDIADELRKETVAKVLDNAEIPAYSFSEVSSMDMSIPSGVTVEDLKLVTRYNLVGLEEKLYQMDQDYDLNCLFLLGIASHESAYGTMQFHKNNLCGYGYSSFSSKEECLDTVGRVLAKNYLAPGGAFYKGSTIDSVNKTYAADPAWDTKVANKVVYFYQVISENRHAQLEKLKD